MPGAAGRELDQKGIQDHLNAFAATGTISKYAVPGTVLFVDAIDKTSVGKLNKRMLREKYDRP